MEKEKKAEDDKKIREITTAQHEKLFPSLLVYSFNVSTVKAENCALKESEYKRHSRVYLLLISFVLFIRFLC